MNLEKYNLKRQKFGSIENSGNLPTKDWCSSLLSEWVTKEGLRLHMRQVAALMRAWAEKRNLSDLEVEKWEIAGLLHDADWDQYPDEHCRKIVELLESQCYDPELIHGIASHSPRYFGVTPVNELDHMLWAFDELSGFIHAVSLMRPTGYEGMKPSSVRKKLKSKGFAAQVDREEIAQALNASNLDLSEFCSFIISIQKTIQ